MPKRIFISSIARWGGVPTPYEPIASWPGRALAWAISPESDVMPEAFEATRTSGLTLRRATGVMSFSGSKIGVLASMGPVIMLAPVVTSNV